MGDPLSTYVPYGQTKQNNTQDGQNKTKTFQILKTREIRVQVYSTFDLVVDWLNFINFCFDRFVDWLKLFQRNKQSLGGASITLLAMLSTASGTIKAEETTTKIIVVCFLKNLNYGRTKVPVNSLSFVSLTKFICLRKQCNTEQTFIYWKQLCFPLLTFNLLQTDTYVVYLLFTCNNLILSACCHIFELNLAAWRISCAAMSDKEEEKRDKEKWPPDGGEGGPAIPPAGEPASMFGISCLFVFPSFSFSLSST